MRILLLGPERPEFEAYLVSFGDEIIRAEKRLTLKAAKLRDVDWLVSYGYRHILKPEVLNLLPRRAINLHISYLPYNRGADPNLWSFLEDSPKGVTIHYLDEGIDTGDILAQKEIVISEGETLESSYKRLNEAIVDLFKEVWPDIREGRVASQKQSSGGSIHCSKDKDKFQHLLVDGWDTPVEGLIAKAIVNDESIRSKGYSYGD